MIQRRRTETARSLLASVGLFNKTGILYFLVVFLFGFLDAVISGFIRFPALRTSNSLFFFRKIMVVHTLLKKNRFSKAEIVSGSDCDGPKLPEARTLGPSGSTQGACVAACALVPRVLALGSSVLRPRGTCPGLGRLGASVRLAQRSLCGAAPASENMFFFEIVWKTMFFRMKKNEFGILEAGNLINPEV